MAANGLYKRDLIATQIRTGIKGFLYDLYLRDNANDEVTRYLLYCFDQQKAGPTTPDEFV